MFALWALAPAAFRLMNATTTADTLVKMRIALPSLLVCVVVSDCRSQEWLLLGPGEGNHRAACSKMSVTAR